LVARVNSWNYPFLGIYTGNAMDSLSEVGCLSPGGAGQGELIFPVEAGITYFIQTGTLYGHTGMFYSRFYLEKLVLPVAGFTFSPSEPTVLDSIQFWDNSYDPRTGWVWFTSYTWDFGDGSTAEGAYVSHQYAADGDYTVTHSVTTNDGRTGVISQVISVRTHDVAITQFTTPRQGKAGQTHKIRIGVQNFGYPETVEVQLYKNTGNGYELVGTLTLDVPFSADSNSTDFVFDYTFTREDAFNGKVTFKAVAVLVGSTDTIPYDNEVIDLSTYVKP
jgi:PKD repeat protein